MRVHHCCVHYYCPAATCILHTRSACMFKLPSFPFSRPAAFPHALGIRKHPSLRSSSFCSSSWTPPGPATHLLTPVVLQSMCKPRLRGRRMVHSIGRRMVHPRLRCGRVHHVHQLCPCGSFPCGGATSSSSSFSCWAR